MAEHITNGDRIRAMSDGQLAEFLLDRDLAVVRTAAERVGFSFRADKEKCLENMEKWLMEEIDVAALHHSRPSVGI